MCVKYQKKTDEINEAETYLNQIGKIDSLVSRHMQMLEEQRNLITRVKSPAIDKSGVVSHGADPDKLGAAIAKIEELEGMINGFIDDLVTAKIDALNIIREMTDLKEQELLIARYVQGKTIDRISREMFEDSSNITSQINKSLLSFYHVWKIPMKSNEIQ